MGKVIMFTTPSCGGCKILKPIIEEKGFPIEIVDSTVETARAEKHGITSVPVFVKENSDGEPDGVIATGAIEGMAYLNDFERFH